jgi:hypothetical protein
MPRNIEIKARIDSVEQLQPRVAALADQGPMQIAQDDRFYECANGRLKLRRFAADRGELIFYRRADEHGPKESFYLRSPTDDPEGLHATLAAAWGERGRVSSSELCISRAAPASTWTVSKAWATSSSSRSCWPMTMLPTRACARRMP